MSVLLWEASGVLRYRVADGRYWLTLCVDEELARYYRSLLPAYWNVVPGRPAHVTVVRGEESVFWGAWGKYEGGRIGFYYEPGLRWNERFFWLRVLSKQVEDIRRELGLSVERQDGWSVPPDGFSKYFHMTIGERRG